MLCSLLFKNCITLEDYKYALKMKIKIFTFLDGIGLLTLLLNISSESTNLFTFSHFTHSFLAGFSVSMILLSAVIICRTKKLLRNETKLLNEWEKFKQDN